MKIEFRCGVVFLCSPLSVIAVVLSTAISIKQARHICLSLLTLFVFFLFAFSFVLSTQPHFAVKKVRKQIIILNLS